MPVSANLSCLSCEIPPAPLQLVLGQEHSPVKIQPDAVQPSSVQPVKSEALPLFSQPGLENNLNFLHRHTEIIRRFGRYPHRNAVLGRASTPEELAFLQQPGSAF